MDEVVAVISQSERARTRFLACLMLDPSDIHDLQQRLTQDEDLRRGLCAAYFLADTRPEFDVAQFVTSEVPLLLRCLSRATQPQRIEQADRIRGRIDWPATYKARTQAEYNPGLYVYREIKRRYDTPENQLLKYLLVNIAHMIGDVPDCLMTAEQWSSQNNGAPYWLATRLQPLRDRIPLLLSHIRVREISLPTTITSRHLIRARTSKSEFYGAIAQLYVHYEQIVLRYRWNYLRQLFRHTLLLPIADDEQANTYLRLAAIGLIGLPVDSQSLH
jgi:hypothetical protein